MAKNKHAVALGRKGGKAGKGQPASAAKLEAVRANGRIGAAVRRHRSAVAALDAAERAYAAVPIATRGAVETAKTVDASRIALDSARSAVGVAAAALAELRRANG